MKLQSEAMLSDTSGDLHEGRKSVLLLGTLYDMNVKQLQKGLPDTGAVMGH